MKNVFLPIICLTLLATNFSIAKVWHVDTKGNDGNNGSFKSPFKNIQTGIKKSEPGDTVLIHSGNYQIEKQITFNKSGISGKRIYLIGEDNVTLDAQNLLNHDNGKSISFGINGALHIEKSSFITIQNITVINSHAAGIIVKGPSKKVEILKCNVENTFNSGIAVWYSDSTIVQYCNVSRANRQEMRESYPLLSEAPHEAISLCGATHFNVSYNEVHHCDKEGIDCKEVSAFGIIHHNYVHDMPRQGLYVDSWFGLLHDVAFYSNTVTRCEWGMAISGEGSKSSVENIEIHHNLFCKNRGSGLLFGVWGDNNIRKNISIYNNTIADNGTENHWAGMVGGVDMKSSNLLNITITKNIIFNNYHFQIALPAKEKDQSLFLKNIQCIIDNNLSFPFKKTPDVQKSYFKDVFATKGNNTFETDPKLDINYVPNASSPVYSKSKTGDLGAFEKSKDSLYPPQPLPEK